MKKTSMVFLQGIIVLIGLITLAIMIRMPLTEGRAINLDLFHIYSDPFIMYGYLASISFFIGLYQAFKLLGYVGKNEVFTSSAVMALRNIKYSAIVLSILIVLAGLYIKIFHAEGDDPAGFLALCIVTTFVSVVIATVVAVFEKNLQSAVDIKSENQLIV